MAGPDKDEALIPGGGSVEAVDDDRLAGSEGVDAEHKEGGFVTFDDHIQIVHVGRSFRMAALLMLFLALAVAVRAPWAWVFGVGGIAFYPVSAALFWASAALLLSDITVLGGLLLAALAILLCGISTGERLALVAVKRKTGLRGAIRAAWRLDRRARERAWTDLVGER